MNEMYAMGIVTHNIGVMGMLAVILINFLMLVGAQDIRRYAKRMRIFMPIGAGLIATILFTGAVMMAAKHLHFTFENSVMTVFGVLLIILEAKRYKKLKYINMNEPNPLERYKAIAYKILSIEFFGSLLITVWMFV
ncbi:MAG: hypothetical protein RBR54_08540 [Sulfurimonas sp.]|jgi:hypothetical protein|nr:hypothetical protein [Sulfurimonas sp.]